MTFVSFIRCTAAAACLLGVLLFGPVAVSEALARDYVSAARIGAVALAFALAARKLFAGTLKALKDGKTMTLHGDGRRGRPAYNPVTGLRMANRFIDSGGNPYGARTGVNPATGLRMVGGVDVGGNPFGGGPLK